ncbi:MAG: hypothetical protein HY063_04225 [Bacteroidetes bacterium]|nr:hypothetical protein [Bacteroidota bacterium]
MEKTITEIPNPKITEKEKFIYSPDVKVKPCSETKHKILRLELDDDLTRIDFVYNNGRYGWAQIAADSFIRPVGTETCLPLVRAVGIPLAPQKYYFTKPNQNIYYTLYFPPLPREVRAIDIIEKEIPNSNFFNFYGVSVEKIKKEVITVGIKSSIIFVR